MRQVRVPPLGRVQRVRLVRLASSGALMVLALVAQQLFDLRGLFWMAVLITATLSAINEWELRGLRCDLEVLSKMTIDLEQLQKFASTDGLTGIANRRAFDTVLEREVARAARNGSSVSLVMLDIDRFKRLNDAHGHQRGDDVLRTVAAGLAKACREYDTAARYGGDEFAMILPNCSPEEALVAAERLRLAVAEAHLVLRVTVSGGIATFPMDGPDAVELVAAADEALYTSKRTGRDRVTASSSAPADGKAARHRERSVPRTS